MDERTQTRLELTVFPGAKASLQVISGSVALLGNGRL